MRRLVLSIGMIGLLLLAACSFGDDDDDDSADTPAEAVATATTGRAATPTAAATDTPSRATATPEDEPEPTATNAEPAATPTAEDDDGTPTPLTGNSEVEAEIDEIEADIVDIRGLELKQDVPAAIITRDELRDDLAAQLEEDYSPEEAERDARVLWLLRLIEDPDLDLYAFQLDLLSEQVVGYYDPEEDRLVLVSDADGLSGLAELTMSHELTHALQDQYYDLESLRPEESDNLDRDAAVTALIEGDAEYASTRYIEYMEPDELLDLMTEAATLSSDVLDNAPPYLRESLIFPYQQGMAFVEALISEGEYAAVDEVYADLPASTEQILHPEKYIDERDDPRQVELPDVSGALGAGWSEEYVNTIGEFDVQIMLRENGATAWDDAAEGWDGSTFALYGSGDQSLLVLGTVWDSATDAGEFVDALRETVSGSGDIFDAGQGRSLGLKEVDGTVYVVTGTDRAAVEAALGAL
jgi:hypothetical protein